MKTGRFISLLLIALLPLSCGRRGNVPQEEPQPQKDTIYPLGFLTDTLEAREGKILPGDNFTKLMTRAGLSSEEAYRMALVCDTVFDVRKMIADKSYTAYYHRPDSLTRSLRYLVYKDNKVTSTVFRCFDSLAVWKVEKQITYEEKYADVTITESLWNDFRRAGAPVDLIISLSDIYAWTVDFFGLQKGDSFKLMYTQRLCEGEVLDVDHISYAVFRSGDKEFPAVLYDRGDGGNVYWNEKGESMRKAFLKAPLQFSRISSGFSYARRNPVTGRVQPHTAVDYAAPAGTPVVSIGDGTVISAGFSGAAGNMVKIRHNSVYSSAYLHLSRYGAGIKAGARVKQGQVIGYVGSTGRSTGPHLDFRVWQNGSAINPLKMQSPPEEPLPESAIPAFDSLRLGLKARLDSLSSLVPRQN